MLLLSSVGRLVAKVSSLTIEPLAFISSRAPSGDVSVSPGTRQESVCVLIAAKVYAPRVLMMERMDERGVDSFPSRRRACRHGWVVTRFVVAIGLRPSAERA